MKFYTLLFSSILISLMVKAQVPSCIPGGAGFTFKDTCSNMPTSFYAIGGTDPMLTYKWDFGDPASGAANIVFGQNPTHTFTAPAVVNVPVAYNVRMTIAGPGCADTVDQTINIYLTPLTVSNLTDTLICGSISLTASGGSTYLWSDGQTGSTVTIKEGGTYWVKTSQNGCSAADTFKISVWGQGNHGDYNWNFGSGGLNFSTNPPQVISSGGNSFPLTSASMSTPSGQLLFYTDGQTVFDKNNTPMTNGTVGTAATDNVLIVPDPRSNNNYYVFTSSPSGLTYSVVDMSLNGGAGDVTQTNVKLDPSANVGVLAGLSDSAGAFWVSAYDNTLGLVAYKINNAGIIATPVISSAGVNITLPDQGNLKFSNDGSKAALVVPGQNLVEVYDFDRATGTFSNPVQISVTTPAAVEFSKDNSKLYVGTDGDHNLYQYDLSSIATAPVVISTNPGLSYDDLHLAPDGRIFVALGNSGSIGIINYPDLSGASAGYTSQSGVINTNTSLPNIIADYFTSKNWAIAYMDTCANSPTLFQFTAPDSVRNWTWYFDNVADPQVNYPGSQTTQHTFTTPGSHPVRLVVNHHCGTKDTTITINIVAPPVLNLPANSTVCVAGDSAKLDATNLNSTYLWSTGETTPVIYAKTTGTYSVVVTNSAGCTATGSSNVTFINQPKPNLGNDTTLCNGQTLNLSPGSYPTANSITWTGAVSSNAASIVASATGQYEVTVSFASCDIKDTIQVKVIPLLAVNLGANDTLCNGTNKLIGITDPYPGLDKLVWHTVANPGSVIPGNPGAPGFLNVSTSGDYILLDSIDRCSASDTVHIEFVAPPTTPSLGSANTYCVNSFHTLDAGSAGVPGVSYLWSPNGATTRQTTVSSGSQGPVTYSVVVTVGKGGASGGCSSSGQVTYTYVIPPIINLGPASATYCEGNSITLDADPGNSHPAFTYLWNPGGETTSSITVTTTGVYSVMAKQGSCFSAPASKNLTFNPRPAISLPPQIAFCKSKQHSVVIRVSGGAPAYTYDWGSGITTADSLEVFQEGTYSVSSTLGNCPITVSTNVVSICEAVLFVPTAFSPLNNDEINQEFKLFGDGIEDLDFRIYDRWGELIFVATDLSQKWDGKYKGKPVQEGVYIWKVTYTGRSEAGTTKYSKDGDLTVIK